MTIAREKIKEEKGQAVIEFAFVVPIVLLLVMVGITLSLFIYSQIIVTMSASNGARVGAAIWHNDTYSQAEKTEKIKNAALAQVESNLYGEERRYKVDHSEGMLRVTVEYDFKVALPFSSLIFDEGIIVIVHTAEIYVGD